MNKSLMKEKVFNKNIIAIIISPKFGAEISMAKMVFQKDLPVNNLENIIEDIFQVKVHICGDSPQEFHALEERYFNDNYRAYIRPFDTPDERLLAQELLSHIINVFESSSTASVTFLYKIDYWTDQYKTFYKRFY